MFHFIQISFGRFLNDLLPGYFKTTLPKKIIKYAHLCVGVKAKMCGILAFSLRLISAGLNKVNKNYMRIKLHFPFLLFVQREAVLLEQGPDSSLDGD